MDEERRESIGAGTVPLAGVIAITAYLVLLAVLLISGLVTFWPEVRPEGAAADEPVRLFHWSLRLSNETMLFCVVAMAGALGSLVHALKSLYWYVGNRALVWSWLGMYVLLPLVGATLGLVFYLVVRGGFFSTQATIEEMSPFGFAALASLVGMFSEQAVQKLKEVAETLLSKAPPGKDAATGTDE